MAGMKPLVYALAAVAFPAAAPAVADDYASDWARASKAEARLVAGAPGHAAVEVRLAPGAITYWRNPGATPDALSVGFCIDQTNETVPGGYPGAKLNWFC